MGRSRRKRGAGEGDGFGMSLLDLLTTALGCVLLIFIVYSVKSSGDMLRFVTENKDMIEVINSKDGEIKGLREEIAKLRARIDELLRILQDEKESKDAEDQKRRLELEKLLAQLRDIGVRLDPSTARPVDVMLVIDGTNSMEPSLDAVRQNLRAIIGALQVLSPTARVGITVYRDQRELESTRLQYQGFSSNADTLREFLQTIKAMSTSRDKDRPEWMCGGLRAGILGPEFADEKKSRKMKAPQSSPWRKNAIKIAVIVSDAGSNSPQAKACIEVAKQFKQEGGQVHVVSTLPRGYGARAEITREYDQEVLRDHEAVANAGGGEHIKRASESTLLEKVLETAFRSRLAELERLKEIIDDRKTSTK